MFSVGKYHKKSIKLTSITEYRGVFVKNHGTIDNKAKPKKILSPKLGFFILNFRENKKVIKIHKFVIKSIKAHIHELS